MMVKRKSFYSFFAVWLAIVLAMLALGANTALAADGTTTGGGGLLELFAALFGADKAAVIMQVVIAIGFIWSVIIRPWIPADKLAKLPGWVIALLEVFAGNYKKASNETINSPSAIRKRG
ncbi:hypothetical protein MYC06_004741 [Vibrio parahaemolyticus]|nr:hypothetical protein [Vibrio parahaemolyticus]EJC7066907.1 hypothetical protein [Vibrio parahaemolyticus]